MRIKAKVLELPNEDVAISTDYIKLDSFLKLCGACETGGLAKEVILEGDVCLNGEVCTQRGRKLRPGDVITFARKKYTVISG
ncbi:MAG: RNA-binding S4 domain-containing protein [Oscillospiraceae bacterium]|nr:RNA-binding S4 domain-containing protein [Oscillospiraceae bacterium]